MSNLTDTGEQARPKRMQGVSCDACKFRKVKDIAFGYLEADAPTGEC